MCEGGQEQRSSDPLLGELRPARAWHGVLGLSQHVPGPVVIELEGWAKRYEHLPVVGEDGTPGGWSHRFGASATGPVDWPTETRDRRSLACRATRLGTPAEGPAQRAACAGDTE